MESVSIHFSLYEYLKLWRDAGQEIFITTFQGQPVYVVCRVTARQF